MILQHCYFIHIVAMWNVVVVGVFCLLFCCCCLFVLGVFLAGFCFNVLFVCFQFVFCLLFCCCFLLCVFCCCFVRVLGGFFFSFYFLFIVVVLLCFLFVCGFFANTCFLYYIIHENFVSAISVFVGMRQDVSSLLE